MIKYFLIPLLLLGVKLDSSGQINKEKVQNTVQRLADTFSSPENPGMAIGVIQDGEILFEGYYGKANLEFGIDIDANTRFNIASNCKQFTALCILNLVQEGKINLEDDFRLYIPDVLPDIEKPITLTHLITHMSGIRDVYELYALQGKSWWKQFIDNDDALDLLRSQTGLNFAPGSEYLYSNSNYLILAEVVEVVSGQRFSDYSKSLFQKLGMNETEFQRYYSIVVPNKATAYGDWGSGWRECPSITSVHGDGSLYTTLRDQLRWEQIIQLNNDSALPKEVISQSQLPIYDNHGFGVEFGMESGIDYSFHNGSTCSYNANYLRFPGKQLSIVVMSNGVGATSEYISWEIARAILFFPEIEASKYPERPQDIQKIERLDQCVGYYQNQEGTVIQISQRGDSLYREMYQREPVSLKTLPNGMFEYTSSPGLRIAFENLGDKDQSFTIYKSTQQPDQFVQVSDFNVSSLNLEELNGTFFNEETDTEIILKHEADRSFILIKNGREWDAELVIPDRLRMNQYTIVILRDDQDNITGLSVDKTRIKQVQFEKR